MSIVKIAFWIAFGLMLVNIAPMMFWTLPELERLAGGEPVFDVRMSGYNFDDAKTVLNALGPEGSAFYSNFQNSFNLSFPALLSLTFGLAIFILAPTHWGQWRFVLAATAIPGAWFNYWENTAVGYMLELGPENITNEIVAVSSRQTVLKAQFMALSLAVLLALLAYWSWRKLSSNSR